MTEHKSWLGPADYQIVVKGHLRSQWSEWFEDVTIESAGTMTTITAKVLDQPALHGLLIRVRDLGLPLISVKRVNCAASLNMRLFQRKNG